MRISSSNVDNRDDRQPLSCVWREVQSVPATSGCPRTRFKHTACVHGNHVYICSGKDSTSPLKDIWRYHLGTGKWERLMYRGTTLPHLEGHTVVSYKRLLLIFGGEFSTGTTEPSLWIINLDQQHIHKPCGDSSMPQPTSRRDHSALVHCGIMYIYGGFVDLRGSSSELWGYHTDEDYWKLYMPSSVETPGGRHGHSCVLYHNTMWVFGGLCDLTIKAELWTYNFLSQKWQRVRCVPSPPPMTGHSADVVNEHMVVIGGENQGELYRDVWLYAFESNIWRKIALHNSPYQPLPCSQHATVCITKGNNEEPGADNSARCFSEAALQGPASSTSHAITGRPRTSPSVESAHPSASKWVYPVKAASRNCDILSLELLSVNSSDVQSVNSSVVGHQGHVPKSCVMTVDDQRPLLRFVSRDSTDSVGIDNVVDCTADEQRLGRDESHIPISKLCSTTGLSEQTVNPPNAKEQYSFVNNLQHDFSVSIDQSRTQNNDRDTRIRPNTVIQKYRTNQTSDHSSSGTIGSRPSSKQTMNSLHLDVSPQSVALPTQPLTTQAPKEICSRYCDDLYIEDIEQEHNTSAESAQVVNPFTFSKDELIRESRSKRDWVELDTFSAQPLDSGQSSRSSVKQRLSHESSSVAVEDGLHSSNETQFVKHGTEGEGLGYKKVLVTVATQTGSNLDLRPDSVKRSKDQREDDNEIYFEGAPYLLVFGGKVNKGQMRQQPIKVWRCDINV